MLPPANAEPGWPFGYARAEAARLDAFHKARERALESSGVDPVRSFTLKSIEGAKKLLERPEISAPTPDGPPVDRVSPDILRGIMSNEQRRRRA